MELIKKNIVLFVVLGVALVVSIVLGIFVYQASMMMQEHQGKLLVQKDKIKNLIEEKPSPLKDNLDAIKLDTEQLQLKVQEIHQIFGKPYRAAIQAFAAALQVSEYVLYSEWRSAYNNKNAETDEQVFLKFINQYEEKIDSAINAFKSTIEKRTVENLNRPNIDQLIMEGLGLPRTMSAEACKTYMSDMELRLNNLMKSRDVGLGLPIIFPESPSIFNVYGDNMPLREHLGLILKHYSLLEDLAYRMKAAGIKKVNTLARSSFEGIESNGFLTFTYDMQIVSSTDSIRNLINNFLDAYKDNRIYIVRDIILKKVVDETKSIRLREVAPGEKGRTVEMPSAANEKADDYGVVVIENSIDVVANIRVDYVIYIADEIGRK